MKGGLKVKTIYKSIMCQPSALPPQILKYFEKISNHEIFSIKIRQYPKTKQQNKKKIIMRDLAAKFPCDNSIEPFSLNCYNKFQQNFYLQIVGDF